MTELNKLVGAKFLVDSRFIVQSQLSTLEQYQLPKEKITEIINHQMVQKVSEKIIEKFKKEIKLENLENNNEQYTLEFYAFPKEAFKLMIEYIIHEIPEHEIQRIKSLEY